MADLDMLKEAGAIRKFGQDEVIFNEGEPGEEMFIVLAGKVGVYISSFNGFPLKVTDISPGSFFGEMSLLDNQPRSATVTAIEDTTVLVVNRAGFQGFIARKPDMAYKIMRGLCSRIRALNEDLSKLREGSAQVSSNKAHSSTNILSEATAASTEAMESNSILFPPGHKTYSLKAPQTHEAFLTAKQVKCPLCKGLFDVKVPRLSKLRMDRIEDDFRKKYVDFEPLWYNIWVCPHCLYSNFSTDFEILKDSAVKPVSEFLGKLKPALKYVKSEPLSIDNVFTGYYLTLNCIKAHRPEPFKPAKLWLQLRWLYNDVQDGEMAEKAGLEALQAYHDAFYNSKISLPKEQEQQCQLIMGELYLVKGDKNEALKAFQQAIDRRNGVGALNQKAQDRIYEIRKSSGDAEFK